MSALIVALAWSLVHAVWIGALAWAARTILDPWLRTPAQAYGASAIALFGTFAGWILAWWASLSGPSVGGGLPVPPPTWPTGLVLVWTAGVAGFGVHLLGGLWWQQHTVRHALPLPALADRFTQLAARAGVPHAALRQSDRVPGPCTMGWWRPVVLLPPATVLGLDAASLEAILLHELAHVARRDWLVSLMQAVVEVWLFHVPFVAWLSRRMRQERERCADERAATWVGSRPQYARALVALSSLHTARGWAPAAHGGHLTHRVHALLRPAPPSRTGAGASSTVLASILVASGVAWAVGTQPGLAPWLPPDVARWHAVFVDAADAHDVDPNLLAVMTLVESGGEPDARSPMGATGLLQLMPATAEAVARARGLPHQEGDLVDPAHNIDLGASYLASQLDAFDGDVALAVAAYNAGPAAVRRHLAGEPLPKETEAYQARVLALWRDRGAASSSAYDGWWAARRAHYPTTHPLPEGRLVSEFGGPKDHHGVDLAAPRGTPVRAILGGRVVRAQDDGRHGLTVWLAHATGLQTRYDHLDGIDVTTGDAVAPGSQIGTVGSSGVSSGPHLHLEVRAFGAPVDPQDWIPGTP